MDERFEPRRRSWPEKFSAAGRGCVFGTRGHNSFLVHIPAAVAAVGLAAWFQIAAWEWCVVVGCITAVLTSELFNSAVEMLAKAVTPNRNPHVAQALDIASGAVLVAALGAAAAGLVIFGPRIVALGLMGVNHGSS